MGLFPHVNVTFLVWCLCRDSFKYGYLPPSWREWKLEVGYIKMNVWIICIFQYTYWIMADFRGVFRCTYCRYVCRQYRRLLNHLFVAYSDLPRFNVECAIDTCLNKYTVLRSYKRHLKKDTPISIQTSLFTKKVCGNFCTG